MEEQAGRMGAKLPTVDELLQQAEGGWSKFARHADDIERLVAGGVRQKTIEAWLAAQGVKSARGELSHWLSRRRNRRTRLGQVTVQSVTAQSVPREHRQPTASDSPELTAAATKRGTPALEPLSGRPMRSADERSGTSPAELDMEAKVAAALAEANANKGRRPQRARPVEGE